jgi:hypothetical protein
MSTPSITSVTPVPLAPTSSLPPKTTEQEDITLAGQRRVNLIWESTQASIALIISLAMVYGMMKEIYNATITNAFFLIIGTYFTRTNHVRIGGIGDKPYQGR